MAAVYDWCRCGVMRGPGRRSLCGDGVVDGGVGVVTWNVFGGGVSGMIWITGFSWKYWGATI